MSHCPYLESNDLPKKKALVSLALSISLFLLAVGLVHQDTDQNRQERVEEIDDPAKHRLDRPHAP